MTAEERAKVEEQLDELLAEVASLGRRLDGVIAALTAAAA